MAMDEETRQHYLGEIEEMRAQMSAIFDIEPGELDATVAQSETAWREASASFRDARRTCGPIFDRRPTRELRRLARTVVMCSDCAVVIGLVIPVGKREVLLTRRRRKQGWCVSMWLDAPFWGDEAFCERRTFALHLGDLAAFEGRVMRVVHSLKDLSAVD